MPRPIAGPLLSILLLMALPAAAEDAGTCGQADHPDAVAACTRMLDHPDAVGDRRHDILVDRAEAFRHSKAFDNALADYHAVIRLRPRNDAAYINRGNVHDDRGDKDAAIADYDAAIRINPRSELAYYNRCGTWYDKGEADRAIADCSEAIRLNPRNRNAHHNRGGAFSLKGDHDRALADYDQALALDPGFARSHAGRGYLLSIKRDYPGAIAAYDAAIRRDPENGTAFYGRARAHLYSGATGKALADMRRAAELDPDDLYLALWLDLIARRNGKPGLLAKAAAAATGSTKWPAPAISLFLGRTSLDAMFAAVDDPDPFQRTGNICDAQFYGGLWSLEQGNRPEAVRLLRLATGTCPQNTVEWDAAGAELERIGEAPAPRKDASLSRRAR